MSSTTDQPDKQRPPNLGAKVLLLVVIAGVCVVFAVYSVNRASQVPEPLAATAPPSIPVTAQAPASQPSKLTFPNKLKAYDLEDNPVVDGWDTEQFTHLAEQQLHHIKQMLLNPDELDEAHVQSFIDDAFTCDALHPVKLQSVYDDGKIKVNRPVGDTISHQGAAGLVQALSELRAVMPDKAAVHVEFHMSQVTRRDKVIDTSSSFTLAGNSPTQRVEVNAQWQCTWRQDKPDSAPLLVSIHVVEYEQASSTGPALFTDVTESVLGDNESYHKQLLYGTNHWAQRLDVTMGVTLDSHLGAAVGDVNGDGLDDIYYCEHGGLPNRLYIQNPDGSVTDRSTRAGLDFLDNSKNALIIDMDNDGDQDMVTALRGTLIVLANDGSGKFEKKYSLAGEFNLGMITASDFDNDGDLDLYVCVYYGKESTQEGLARPIPYHDANNGGRNILFRNDSDWQFTDVTQLVGMEVNNTRFSLAASWEDFDNDGDQDLYVANDFGRNCLYRNDSGKFVEIAEQAGVQDIAAGMSVSWGDYNLDGLMDLYVSNMYSNAGSRVTFQRQFKQESESQTRSMYQRHARGDTLFENVGDGSFRDVSIDAGVTMGRWAWSSKMADINNDGLEDLLIGNGQMTNDIADDL
jgi:hypothetical protein